MAMRKGEKYECTDPECGCEISVTKTSEALDASRAPRCCCGEDMTPREDSKQATAGNRSRQERDELSR